MRIVIKAFERIHRHWLERAERKWEETSKRVINRFQFITNRNSKTLFIKFEHHHHDCCPLAPTIGLFGFVIILIREEETSRTEEMFVFFFPCFVFEHIKPRLSILIFSFLPLINRISFFMWFILKARTPTRDSQPVIMFLRNPKRNSFWRSIEDHEALEVFFFFSPTSSFSKLFFRVIELIKEFFFNLQAPTPSRSFTPPQFVCCVWSHHDKLLINRLRNFSLSPSLFLISHHQRECELFWVARGSLSRAGGKKWTNLAYIVTGNSLSVGREKEKSYGCNFFSSVAVAFKC